MMNSAFRVDLSTLEQLLPYLKNNRLSGIKKSGLSSNILEKLTPFFGDQVIAFLEEEHQYVFLIHHGSDSIELVVEKVRPPLDPDLANFVMTDVGGSLYQKKASYEYTLLKNLQFDLDKKKEEKELSEQHETYLRIQQQVKEKKKVVLDKWNLQRSQIYDQKQSLMEQNKQLYLQRLEDSSVFYALSSGEQKSNRDDHMKRYRQYLSQIEANKDRILSLHKELDLLEKKIHLFETNTYFYNSSSTIRTRALSKGEEVAMLPQMTKSGGADDLEYVEIGDDEQVSMDSYYQKIKEKIKKMNKQQSQLSNRELIQQLYTK